MRICMNCATTSGKDIFSGMKMTFAALFPDYAQDSRTFE